MKLKQFGKWIIIGLLSVIGIFALLGALRYVGSIGILTTNKYGFVYLLGLVGSVSTLGFVSITTRRLLRNAVIPKDILIISVIFSAIAFVIVALFTYQLTRDMLGVYCAGFFGTKGSCTFLPLLLLHAFVLHPFSLITSGLVSAYGIYRQSSIKSD